MGKGKWFLYTCGGFRKGVLSAKDYNSPIIAQITSKCFVKHSQHYRAAQCTFPSTGHAGAGWSHSDRSRGHCTGLSRDVGHQTFPLFLPASQPLSHAARAAFQSLDITPCVRHAEKYVRYQLTTIYRKKAPVWALTS